MRFTRYLSVRSAVAWGGAWVLALGTACARGPEPGDDASAESVVERAWTSRNTPQSDEVARVGSQVISAQTVTRIASAQNVSAERALELAIRDAVLARSSRVDEHAFARLKAAALARSQVEDVARAARQQGPPSDEEVTELTRAHWLETDRPAMRRTTQVVVVVDEDTDRLRAKTFAELLAQATASSPTAAAFREAADRVIDGRQGPDESLDVRVEDLAPVAADGRAAEPDAPMPAGFEPRIFDSAFVRAVYDLETVGSISPVVESPFGYHVILLTELVAEKRVTLERRRELFRDEIHTNRARERHEALLKRLRGETHPQVSANADALTELVQPDGSSLLSPRLTN